MCQVQASDSGAGLPGGLCVWGKGCVGVSVPSSQCAGNLKLL